jgi:hypothetical protein
MLRPQSNRFLGSTRAERRRNMRREKARAVGQVFEGVREVGLAVLAGLSTLLLLWGLPLLYAASSFLLLALPLRWATGRARPDLAGVVELVLAFGVAMLGLFRAASGARPIAPVRPVFARAMLGLCWLSAALLVAADIWGKS